jgi:transposase InsO family protein
LNLEGRLSGHFKKEVKKIVVNIIKDAVNMGLTQKSACLTFGLDPRKFRRWADPKPVKERAAWNKLLSQERQAIIDAAYKPQLLGKPLSHIFVHGHTTGEFYASLSAVYTTLKSVNLVKPIKRPRKVKTRYIGIHELMNAGFSVLCYDGTQFITDSGIIVWAIPVLLLPFRYLLAIGHSINSVASSNLVDAVKQAAVFIPERIADNLVAHSDRGSAMKSSYTRRFIKDLLGIPVHFGRPHSPDDESWIEAFNRTLKYHRDAPTSFPQVDDVVRWLNIFPDIYNNEPHSALKYVTPAQALAGKMEVILNQRKINLALARNLRYNAWKRSKSNICTASNKTTSQAEQVEVTF